MDDEFAPLVRKFLGLYDSENFINFENFQKLCEELCIEPKHIQSKIFEQIITLSNSVQNGTLYNAQKEFVFCFRRTQKKK